MLRRVNEHVTIEELGGGRGQLIIQKGHNYHDRDANDFLPTPAGIAADDRSPGYSHVHKGPAWKRIGRGGKHRLGFGIGQDVSFLPVGAATVLPQIGGNGATFSGLWPGADVVLTTFPEGIKEDVILRDASAPRSFTWAVQTRGVLLDPSGEFVDPMRGVVVGRLALATVQDANGVSGAVSQTITADSLTVTVDETWLATAAYPVTIDPTATIQSDGTAGKDAYIRQGAPTNNYGSDVYIVFGDDPSGSAAYRELMGCDLSSIPAGKGIIAAQLELLHGSGVGNPTTLATANVYKVTSSWVEASVTWSTAPTFDTTVLSTKTNITTSVVWSTWTGLGALVQGWYDGSIPNYGVILKKPTDGSAANDSKVFHSSDATTAANRPIWRIDYGNPPTATITSPIGQIASPTAVDSLTPTVTGSYSSPDAAAQGHYRFRLLDIYGALILDQGKTAGTANSWAIPAGNLVWNTEFQIEFTTWDNRGVVSAAVTGFIIPRPAAPTNVAATDNADHARIDLTWTASTSANVAGYRLYRKANGADDSTKKLIHSLIVGTSCSDDTAASGTTYQYALCSITTDGTVGPLGTWVADAVTYTGAWVADTRVSLAKPPQFIRPRLVSARTATDGSLIVQDRGYGPRRIRIACQYRSLAEVEALLALLPPQTLVAYRDDQGRVLRGYIVSDLPDDPMEIWTGVWGTLTVELGEVSV